MCSIDFDQMKITFYAQAIVMLVILVLFALSFYLFVVKYKFTESFQITFSGTDFWLGDSPDSSDSCVYYDGNGEKVSAIDILCGLSDRQVVCKST